MSRPYVVILTACIDPGSRNAQIVRRDPHLRLADYVDALRFWLELEDPRLRRIVFLENSGYPLDALRATAEGFNPLQKTCEFLTLEGNDLPPHVHYGYGELLMLDRGLASSRLCATSAYMIKATGRLKFPGIARLIDCLPHEYKFAVDSRNNRLIERHPRIFTTSQLMLFSIGFYKRHMLGIADRMLEGKYDTIEKMLYDHLLSFRSEEGAILRWPVNCRPSGQAAHWRKSYDSAPQRSISGMRAASRRVFPNWWI